MENSIYIYNYILHQYLFNNEVQCFYFLIQKQVLLNLMPLRTGLCIAQYSLHVAAFDFSLCAWLPWLPLPAESE